MYSVRNIKQHTKYKTSQLSSRNLLLGVCILHHLSDWGKSVCVCGGGGANLNKNKHKLSFMLS